MSQLIKFGATGPYVARGLPHDAFKIAGSPNAKPDMKVINAGQGDGRANIKPNVPWPTEPSVEYWEGGRFVRLQDWLARDDNTVLATADGVGVILMSHEDPMKLQGHLEGVGLIAIDFPRFSDGRGNSLANLIRTRLGWRKEVRAVGDVLIDQLFFMSRCGFDAFALRDGQDIDSALAAFNSLPSVYQNNADHRGFALQASDTVRRAAA